MKDWLRHLYYLSPYPLKVLAASAWGYYLGWWRYGLETERLVAEALERDYWSPEQWQNWQKNRLAYILHRAATRVPYYREHWNRRRSQGDRSSWEYLENWPILEKEQLRQNPRSFVAEDCNIRYMIEDHTTGTTGTPLVLWASLKTMRTWYALFEARWRNWYGLNRFDRWAHIGGQLVIPVENRRPPFWVWNAALRQLYLSSYHLSPDLIPYYLDALKKYQVKYILGYTSSLYALAVEILRLESYDFHMVVAISDGEPIFDYQREAIEEAFHCPARETYGMAEIVMAASECEFGHLHIWPEAGVLEFGADQDISIPALTDDMLCTGLINADMPLIRYRLGDRGRLNPSKDACSCGRTLPRLKGIEGRIDDVLLTIDGRRIGRLSQVLKNKPIIEGQFIQESLDTIRIIFIPALNYTKDTDELIIKSLWDRMGPINVILEPVKEIPKGIGGKLRAVICNLTRENESI